MYDSFFEQIREHAKFLGVDVVVEELASYADAEKMGPENIEAVAKVFQFLQEKKRAKNVELLLGMSRIPQKSPKTFHSFDFSQLSGKDVDQIKSLPSMAALYAQKNLAFIGPPGVGKTHLAMAYGNECCQRGMKSYFLKATELNDKLTSARKLGRISNTVNGLVRPSCLIIDEIGRCIFDKENTRLFFDVIDRRENKDGPNCIIFTSNKSPSEWQHYFMEDDSLLCALDRVFDKATVFVMKGESYRGRKLETYTINAGDIKSQV